MARKADDHTHVPEPFRDKSRGIRLQKAMAEAGVASRRDCEVLIHEGRVRVNGQSVSGLPAWVDPTRDRIEVDGQPIARPPRSTKAAAGRHHIMLNKPPRVISTTDDPQGRTTVNDLVNVPNAARLYPVGRLDADSTGLILLTDDGELANRLTHPRYEVPKHYAVSVRGRLSQEDIGKLTEGLLLTRRGRPGEKQAPVKRAAMERVKLQGYETDRTRGDRTALLVTLMEGQNREIRRLLARLGYKVRKLTRVGIGPLKLKGLATGQWRPLTGAELRQLRTAAGLETTQSRRTASTRQERLKRDRPGGGGE